MISEKERAWFREHGWVWLDTLEDALEFVRELETNSQISGTRLPVEVTGTIGVKGGCMMWRVAEARKVEGRRV